MKFAAFTYYGQTEVSANVLPVSGSIFWMDVTIAGKTNLANTSASFVGGNNNEFPGGSTYNTSSAIVTDINSSPNPLNAVNMSGANVYDLNAANSIGTIIMVYRFVATGSFSEPGDPCTDYKRQLISFPIITGNNINISNGFPNDTFAPASRGLQVSQNYISGSYYSAYASNSLTKFTPISSSVISSNILAYPGNIVFSGSVCDVIVSGSWNQFPGPASGSGVIHNDTGMTFPKFYAFSPEYVVSGSTNIGIFSSQTSPTSRLPGSFAPRYGNTQKNATNILSLAIFDRVLNDVEVASVYLYYKQQLGYYI